MAYRYLQIDKGGTLVTDELDERPDASPTFVVRSSSGGSLATGTGTVDSVSTTLSSGIAAGATSIGVTSASSIVVGARYRLTGTESVGGEFVTVKSISGTTITVARPVLYSHASGAAFASTRISCVIPSTACTTPERDCRVDVTYTVSAAARPVVSIAFDITRYRIETGLTLEHVRDLDPQLLKRAAPGTWWPAVIDAAWERIVASIGLQKDPGGLVGALDVTQAHAIAVRLLIAEQSATDESRAQATDLRAQLDTEMSKLLASRAFDDDQDGSVESHEGFYRTINIVRG